MGAPTSVASMISQWFVFQPRNIYLKGISIHYQLPLVGMNLSLVYSDIHLTVALYPDVVSLRVNISQLSVLRKGYTYNLDSNPIQ